MLSRDRLLHPGTILGVVALTVALSGAAWAAATIGTADIKNGAVTKAKLANNAVTGAKIAGGAVHAKDLARGAVTGGKLASGAVGAGTIANGAVSQGKLAPNAVTGGALANGSVTTDKLGPNAVTGAKIAGGTITGAKIAAGTITAANIEAGQVVTGRGSLVSARETLPSGAVETTVLTLPNVGLVRASCAAGAATISFTNTSGASVDATASGIVTGTPAAPFISSAVVANGVTTQFSPSPTDIQAMTLQLGYADAANVPHVATATLSTAPAGTSCLVTGQGTTTN